MDKCLSRSQLTDPTAGTEVSAEEDIRFGIHEVADIGCLDLLYSSFSPGPGLLKLLLVKSLARDFACLEEVELKGCT